MRVRAPIEVSFSTRAPRPITTSSSIATRSRTHAWSPTITRAPSVEPANTIAAVEITVPSPTTVGGRGSRLAVERGESVGCLPVTAFSRPWTPSLSTAPGGTTAVGWISAAMVEALGQPVERTDDREPVASLAMVAGAFLHEREEVLELEPERLVVRDLRAVDVTRPRAPLAVALRGLPRRLLVHGDLPLELHVVEDDHLLAPDDGHLPHLVGVEPRQVHVGDLPGREAEEAEDDVFDALLQIVHHVRDRLAPLLAEEPEDHGEVVDAERPERVLVRADHAEVLTVPVDAGDLAQLAGFDELLHLPETRVVEKQMTGHQHEIPLLREGDELLHLLRAHRGRLLDKNVLASLERLLRELVVGRHRRRDRDRRDGVVGERVVERGRDPRVGIALGVVVAPCLVEVADPRQLGELADDASDVPSPAPDARVGDADRQSFQTFSLEIPARPVALRRSTTRLASSTSHR